MSFLNKGFLSNTLQPSENLFELTERLQSWGRYLAKYLHHI